MVNKWTNSDNKIHKTDNLLHTFAYICFLLVKSSDHYDLSSVQVVG